MQLMAEVHRVTQGLVQKFLQHVLPDLHCSARAATKHPQVIIQICNADLPAALDGQLQRPASPLQPASLDIRPHPHW